MKLQLAIDTLSSDEGVKLVEKIRDYIDIIEVGTPLIIKEGISAVKKFKKFFPEKLILADTKIMDAGELEASEAFEAGADIVTVLGVSHDSTISGVVKACQKFNGKVLVDMICVKDLEMRAMELDKLGIDFCCVHTAFDVQDTNQSPLSELEKITNLNLKSKPAVAGGLNLNTIEKVKKFSPEIVIVGGAITNAENKLKTAKVIKELIK